MLLPSIDIMDGQAVQLVGGNITSEALHLGDPIRLLRHFSIAGEVAVVDLDAALGRGSNEKLIMDMLRISPCRVGGGIRTVEKALRYLDGGALKVIIGTKAEPSFLAALPRSRTIAALDCSQERVVVDGWRERTDYGITDRMSLLKEHVSGFLITSVDREGRQSGLDISLLEALGRCRGMDLTIAGGISGADEIREADRYGVNAQVGMALHTGRLSLADAIAAPLAPSDRADGLCPTVIADERGFLLGLAYSSAESLKSAVEQRKGVYFSRSRGLWQKGLESGNWQELLRIGLDCDRDTLLFTVKQHGDGFCHTGSYSCFGALTGLSSLERRIEERIKEGTEGSYTLRLLRDEKLLESKLLEEAGELAGAAGNEVTGEAADLLYFTLVAMARAGISLHEVEKELDRRALRITRRPGDAKKG